MSRRAAGQWTTIGIYALCGNYWAWQGGDMLPCFSVEGLSRCRGIVTFVLRLYMLPGLFLSIYGKADIAVFANLVKFLRSCLLCISA